MMLASSYDLDWEKWKFKRVVVMKENEYWKCTEREERKGKGKEGQKGIKEG